MLKHYLIPNVPMKGHKDPDFKELAYGEGGRRARTLRKNMSSGSYMFFHTRIGDSKYITGYLVLDRVMSGRQAQADPLIRCDGRFDDYLFVGDKAKSHRLRKPIPFNRALAERLSLDIDFLPLDSKSRREAGVIGLATRSHRRLSDKDVSVLLEAIRQYDENTKIQNPTEVQKYQIFVDENESVIPIDEVHKLREIEIQKLLRKNPDTIEKGARVISHEKVLPDGDRLDLLLEAQDGSLIVAEVKAPDKLPDGIPTQLASYARDIEKEYPGRLVRKMIICDGKISPRLQKACESLGIEVVVYGVRLDCFRLI